MIFLEGCSSRATSLSLGPSDWVWGDGIPCKLVRMCGLKFTRFASYRRSIRATSLVVLACATMAAAAWVSMLYFARFALSAAMSTSSILPSAARMFVSWDASESAEKLSLDMLPPF